MIILKQDAKMSADKKYQSLQNQLKKVAVEGTIEGRNESDL